MNERGIGGRALLIGVVVAAIAAVGVGMAVSGGGSDESTGPSTTTTAKDSGTTTSFAVPHIDPKLAKVTSVEAEKPCVQRGERQTIVIEGTPGTQLIYQAIYPDGKVGIEPDYPGGNEQGRISPDGTLTGTWVVGKKAAAGEVKVDVYDVMNTATLGGAAASTTFDVPPKGKPCPDGES